jgi:hypothetical protein
MIVNKLFMMNFYYKVHTIRAGQIIINKNVVFLFISYQIIIVNINYSNLILLVSCSKIPKIS